MRNTGVILLLALFFTGLGLAELAGAQQSSRRLPFRADIIELIPNPVEDTTYLVGNVVFNTDKGDITCDSAIYVAGKSADFRGHVVLVDTTYELSADMVYYNIATKEMDAKGQHVELWSHPDSILAIGTQAYYNRETEYFRMDERPTMYLNYPDTGNMIEVIADTIDYDPTLELANAVGDVKISTTEMSSHSGRAVMYPKENKLELSEEPTAKRGKSTVSGMLITIISENDIVKQIDVVDSARADFDEPTDTTNRYFDKSILRGRRIVMDFKAGELDRVTCMGQAYSWYLPSSQGRPESDENSVSGDTIVFLVNNEQLNSVNVIGGSIGSYVSTKRVKEDSAWVSKADTIDYSSDYIDYSIKDSIITLYRQAHVTSGTVELDARRISLNTNSRILEAFSAAILPDTTSNPFELSAALEPNEIPVRLQDANEELLGDYLEYSIDTKKGRIIQSKSTYEKGEYYGEKAYKTQNDIFYIRDGRYTPCDINYLHFYSSRMKLIQNDKLIARPVIMYIGRLPVMALPYYVFPLKKGRHSGFLPFTVGNIETGGQRYIRNVGYYWAASEYWDWQTSLDYYENNSTINTFNRFRYNKRYVFDGYIEANYARETGYRSLPIAQETHRTRWTIKGAHNHILSPTFKFSATADYQSDATYYQDYSANLEERLNRTTRSQINFTKQFGTRYSVSGNFSHDLNLDTRTRTDYFPNLRVSLPVIYPFGSGSVDAEGKTVQRWYNQMRLTYRPNLINYSNRITIDSVKNLVYDTTITVDTVTMQADTSITLASADTLSYRSRKEYSRIDHAVTATLPLTLARYFTFTTTAAYSETWYKIYRTDRSDAAGIDASTTYRAYAYNFGATGSTKIYGTVYPKVFGLTGLRQVITPSLGYSFAPEVNRHPDIRTYAGGGPGNASRSSLMRVGLEHDYQAKITRGETDQVLDLVSITHSFSYNFENPSHPYSDLNTSFQSNVLPRVNIYGGMTHSFYNPETGDLHFFAPSLLNFNVNATLSIAGSRFLFDDASNKPLKGADSASQLAQPTTPARPKGWRLYLTYSHTESGRGAGFTKSSFIRFSLNFFLTPNTSVSYSQYYDFVGGKTINNQVSITRTLKCWTGNFYWVPIGSNRGYGFRLYVTAIPAIKIDNSQNPFSGSYYESFQNF